VDHAIFFAREDETRHLASLVAVYRGVMLYGDSGAGKSSLINAGLLPVAAQLGFSPERLRVQPRSGEEVVIERITAGEDDAGYLPSALVGDDEIASRTVLSTRMFDERLRAACAAAHRPLIVFDQFEELLTLFEETDAGEPQRRIVDLIITLLRQPLPVKLLFAFREDYLGRVKQLLAACPELVDQALRLAPPTPDRLATIIRGPFERHPRHFDREIAPRLAERLRMALAERFGTGDLSLSEVQTVCLRLWQADDPEALLAAKGVQGLLEDYLGEALDALPGDLRGAAIALLGQMVTSAGTRNVLSAEDLIQRASDDEDIRAPVLEQALERLENESRLVRRERRRDLYLYEVASEFLLPWISQRRDEFRRAQERRRYRRRQRALATRVLLVLAVLVAAALTVLATYALDQRGKARSEARRATSLALASAAQTQLDARPDVALMLALEAVRVSPRSEARSSMIGALAAIRGSRVSGILHGHTDSVETVRFSPDGRSIASAGADATIRLWDPRTRKPIGAPLTGHTDTIYAIAFSPDGRILASAGADGTIRFWDLRAHKQSGKPLTGQDESFNSVAFSPDGRTLASGGDDDAVRLWDTRAHKQISVLRGHTDDVDSVAFSPDGRTLASAGEDRTIRLWDPRANGSLGAPLTGHTGAVYSVAFAPDGDTLASAGDDTMIRLWDVGAQTSLGAPLTGHSSTVESVAFAPDGRTLASGSADATVRLWNLRTRKARAIDQPSAVYSVAIDPDGQTLATGGEDQTVRLWVPDAPRLERPLNGHTEAVASVAFRPDGRILASAGADDKIRLWNPRTREQIGEPLAANEEDVNRVAFSPDGRMLASAHSDNTARLWSTRTHEQIGQPLTGHTSSVYSVVFAPDGRTLATAGSDDTIRFWDVHTRKQIGRPLTGHTADVNSVAFSPDGQTLASASSDKTIRLWDVPARRLRGQPLTSHTAAVFSVAFSPSGRTLASASDDSTIQLWDVRTLTPLGRPLEGHTSSVYAVAFSPDGRTLISAGNDHTVRLWQGIFWDDFDELRERVCDVVGTGLSSTEWKRYASGNPYHQSCG